VRRTVKLHRDIVIGWIELMSIEKYNSSLGPSSTAQLNGGPRARKELAPICVDLWAR
jgi:hypothetical protein